MGEIWEAIKDFFKREWTTEEKILVMFCCVLIGVIKGCFLSSMRRKFKNRYRCGCCEPSEEYWLDDEE